MSAAPKPDPEPAAAVQRPSPAAKPAPEVARKPPELGGPKGLEPTRYGDWERDGRCVDF